MILEENGRQQIAAILAVSGWIIQNYKTLNPGTWVQHLTEEGLKEFEAKLKQESQFAPAPVSRFWNICHLSESSAAKKNPAARFTDLVSIVCFAQEQERVVQTLSGLLAQAKQPPQIFQTLSGKLRVDYLAHLFTQSWPHGYLRPASIFGSAVEPFGKNSWPFMEELNLTFTA
jgi:hypothetical protein